jgi:hypothetical protein
VQKEEPAPQTEKTLSPLAQKAKTFFQGKKRTKSGTNSRFLVNGYEPDFANAQQRGTSECGASLLVSLKNSNNNNRLLGFIQRNDKELIGEPKLLMRQTKEGFNTSWVLTASKDTLELDKSNYFAKSNTFSGGDYFFNTDNDAMTGVNEYRDGLFTQSQVITSCYQVCYTENTPPTGSTPPPPPSGGGGGTNLIVAEQAASTQQTITSLQNWLCKIFNTFCPSGNNGKGDPSAGADDGTNTQRRVVCTIICPPDPGIDPIHIGGAAGDPPPTDNPIDPTCPTGDCCGNENDFDPNFVPRNISDPDGIYRSFKNALKRDYDLAVAQAEGTSGGIILSIQQKNILKNIIIPEYEKTIQDTKKMERSTQEFVFRRDLNVRNNEGFVYYDGNTNTFVMAFGNISNNFQVAIVSHEQKHGVQFIEKKISFRRSQTTQIWDEPGSLYDITDEVEAFDRQYKLMFTFDYGQVNMNGQPSPNFQVTAQLVMQIGLSLNPPAYQNLPQQNINLGNITTTINSSDEIYFVD